MIISIKRAAAIVAFAVIASSTIASPIASAAAVYTETNSAAGNEVQIYRTGDDGSLTLAGTVATGGLGTDGGRGKQGAIAMTKNGRCGFLPNAGSQEISSFAVSGSRLGLVAKASSGGTQPVC